jgi:hypothetical protein
MLGGGGAGLIQNGPLISCVGTVYSDNWVQHHSKQIRHLCLSQGHLLMPQTAINVFEQKPMQIINFIYFMLCKQ